MRERCKCETGKCDTSLQGVWLNIEIRHGNIKIQVEIKATVSMNFVYGTLWATEFDFNFKVDFSIYVTDFDSSIDFLWEMDSDFDFNVNANI